MPDPKKYASPQRILQVWHNNALTEIVPNQKSGELIGTTMPDQLKAAKKHYAGGVVTTPVIYTKVDPTGSGLNEYDLMARMILAVTYTGDDNAKPDMLYQSMIGSPTVAIAQDAKSGTLVIACNKLKVFQDKLVRAALDSEGVEEKFELLKLDDDHSLHAEMRLVNFFYNDKLRLAGDALGVSKPCCRDCASHLEALDIDYSYWHDQNVGKWAPCKPEKKWWLGDEGKKD